MKKPSLLFLACILAVSLAACSSQTKSQDNETENSAGVQVDEGLLNVDVTLAASFFEDTTEEEIRETAKKNGYSDCKINDDGSVTYTMTKKKHAEMLDQLKASFDEMIAGCLEGKDKVDSFVDIQHNDNFSKIDIYVDAEQYTMWDNLYAIAFYVPGAYYQAFAEVAADDMDIVIRFIDHATGEVLSTASYRDFINNLNEESDES